MKNSIPKYTPEYLDSVQERFPDLENPTKSELISALDQNEHGVYEQQVANALHEIDQESILDADDELIAYIFEQMSSQDSATIQSGINYVIQNGGRGDLVLGSRIKEKAQGRDVSVGAPAFHENFNFILSSKDKNYLKPGDQNKIFLILGVNKTGQTDSLGRKKYALVPKLVEVPSTSSMVMKGMMFQKDIDAIQFQESFKKIIK